MNLELVEMTKSDLADETDRAPSKAAKEGSKDGDVEKGEKGPFGEHYVSVNEHKKGIR